MAGDNAVTDLPPTTLLDVGLYITGFTMHGYDWFWVAFVLMISSLLLTVVLDIMVRHT